MLWLTWTKQEMELKLTSCFRSEVASRWTWRHRLWLQKQEVVKVFFVWLRMITSCDRESGPHRVTLVVPSQVHPGGHVPEGCRHFSGRQWEHEGPEADHRPADGLLHTGHAGRWRLLQHHRSQFQSSVFSPRCFRPTSADVVVCVLCVFHSTIRRFTTWNPVWTEPWSEPTEPIKTWVSPSFVYQRVTSADLKRG